MLIPEQKIVEVVERTDMVALVSRYVELKKSGRSWKGRCPFHQEKSASFYVWADSKRFKCFGCQAGGDAIAFVQRYLGKPFTDVVRDLAREAGVDLEAAVDPAAREKAQVKEATDLAYEHFKQCLWDPEKGAAARAYLASRGITEEQVKAFGLGWAPEGWTELADKLQRAGFTEHGLKAGLISPRSRGDGHYDMFRGRLIIPIRSPEGRVIAFGGRLLAAAEGPKYLNSRESRLYNKSETLYGLDMAREDIRRRKSAVLVEGYFDCIGLHQAGVRHAVALCSTALTPGHLAALQRAEAKELVLLLDGDEAGRKAVERLAGALLAGGTPTKVALLPEGEDPDTFARKAGVDGVQGLLSGARPLTEHLFQVALPGGAQAGFEEKMAGLERLRPVAALLPPGLHRSAFFSALGLHSGLPVRELEATLKSKTAPSPAPPAPSAVGAGAGRGVPAAPPPAPAERPPPNLEACYVAFLLESPGLKERDPWQGADDLRHPGLRALLARLGAGAPRAEALFEATPLVKAALDREARHVPEAEPERERAFLRVCQKLAVGRIDERLADIAKEAAKVVGANELTEDLRRLQAERVELLELKKQVSAVKS
jgi:DNA primase